MSEVTSTDGRARRYTRLGLTLLGVFGAALFSRSTQRANRSVGIVPGIDIARTISVGQRHACVTLADGRAQCWGTGGDGNLGDGTLESSGSFWHADGSALPW